MTEYWSLGPYRYVIVINGVVLSAQSATMSLFKVFLIHWLQLRFEFDFTAVRILFDCISTALRPFDDLHSTIWRYRNSLIIIIIIIISGV